jgi:hypothetical protein
MALLAFTLPVQADPILFNNFPINGEIGAWQIDVGSAESVSDSFTLSSSALVTGVQFGAWVESGDSVGQVDWSIGLTEYGSSIASGLAETTSAFDFSNAPYDVLDVSFSTAPVALSSGTYYLTLSGAASSDGVVGWDINDTAGIDAWASNIDPQEVSSDDTCFDNAGISGSCASSFEIEGVTTPEPSSWALLGAGCLAILAARRKLRCGSL